MQEYVVYYNYRKFYDNSLRWGVSYMSGQASTMIPRIGDVFLIRFTGEGSEQSGWRPGVIFQNNVGNIHSPNIIALPLTSSIKKNRQPTHVFVSSKTTGLIKDSIVLCENPERVSKERLGRYLTTLPEDTMEDIAIANLLATSAISFVNPERLLSVWERACSLNAR